MRYSLPHLQPKSDWVQMHPNKNEDGPNQLWINAVNAVLKGSDIGTPEGSFWQAGIFRVCGPEFL